MAPRSNPCSCPTPVPHSSQWRLIKTLELTDQRGKPLQPLWDLRLFGQKYGFVVYGSW